MAGQPHSNDWRPNAASLHQGRPDEVFVALVQHLLAGANRSFQRARIAYRARGLRGMGMSMSMANNNLSTRVAWQLRRNLTPRRLVSFPHLLVLLWVFVLLWGEYWVFQGKVDDCRWENWEDWPAGASPHHLIFVADPQLIDPHTYPDRPWPLSSLTVLITDNYLTKGYRELQSQLQPDSVFFLGDLFDGGREWKTAVGDFKDPKWAQGSRPKKEQELAKEWNKKYGEDFWLQEYDRFGGMFVNNWLTGGEKAGPWQRGRKLVASLPGNHDLGFGDEIKLPVRDRFSAYFGDLNRVDVIGNHSVVSVDTVSLSADSSDKAGQADLKPIHSPANQFLEDVQFTKRKAVEKELRFWRGEPSEVILKHKVEDTEKARVDDLKSVVPEGQNADFPTILLSHVPLYRDPGTPCGPYREHWPPSPRPPGQEEPVSPDARNAISISKGYQYQNALSEDDSVKLIKSVGNVIHVFSGDDHDYCEIVHSERKESVREITVKSLSMAMGIPTPAFVMASLYNPVDEHGKPIPGAPEQTLQTHLCHLPNQISTYIKYGILAVICISAIVVRAILMPVLNFTPFTLAADQNEDGSGNGSSRPPLLPSYKDKRDEEEFGGSYGGYGSYLATSATSGSSKHLSPSSHHAGSRIRGASPTPGHNGGVPARTSSHGRSSKGKHHGHGGGGGARRWGWGETRGPRIDIRPDDYYYDSGKSRSGGGLWRAAGSSSRTPVSLVAKEMVACTWRVLWMVVLFLGYLMMHP